MFSRFEGQIFSYAAATSDAQVLKFGEDKSVPITSASSQHLSSEGWFAVCMKDDDISDTQVKVFLTIVILLDSHILPNFRNSIVFNKFVCS